MAKVPIFSVIIPTYNRANLLMIAVKSVLQQKFKDFELIIVDDGSDDGTKEAITSLDDHRIRYYFQLNQERSSARNKGIELANGKYICFLDDDDYYLTNHLELFYAELAQNNFPKIILRTGFIQMEGEQEVARSDSFSLNMGMTPVQFCAEYFCGVVTLCIPKLFLLNHNFPKKFRHWQDTHLILRLLALYPFKQLSAYTYIYVQHPNMGSRSMYLFSDSAQRIQSNVDAMIHLFDHYGELLNPLLPDQSLNFMVSKKYLTHANGSLVNGNLKLAVSLFMKSVRYNKGFWFKFLYFKFLFKVPVKLLVDWPKAP